MRQLTGVDTSFLAWEGPTTTGHVTSVLVVDPSTSPVPWTFEHLVAHLRSRLSGLEPLTQKLVEVPLGLDRPYWVPDPHFDLENHVHHVGVPGDGGRLAFAELVAAIHERPLDRRRPLWECHLVDGLTADAVATPTPPLLRPGWKPEPGLPSPLPGRDHQDPPRRHRRDLGPGDPGRTGRPHPGRRPAGRGPGEPGSRQPDADHGRHQVPAGAEVLGRAALSLLTSPARAARAASSVARALPVLGPALGRQGPGRPGRRVDRRPRAPVRIRPRHPVQRRHRTPPTLGLRGPAAGAGEGGEGRRRMHRQRRGPGRGGRRPAPLAGRPRRPSRPAAGGHGAVVGPAGGRPGSDRQLHLARRDHPGHPPRRPGRAVGGHQPGHGHGQTAPRRATRLHAHRPDPGGPAGGGGPGRPAGGVDPAGRPRGPAVQRGGVERAGTPDPAVPGRRPDPGSLPGVGHRRRGGSERHGGVDQRHARLRFRGRPGPGTRPVGDGRPGGPGLRRDRGADQDRGRARKLKASNGKTMARSSRSTVSGGSPTRQPRNENRS